MRHVPVVYVDYPGPSSLTQIYGTFNRAMLRLIPSLRSFAQPLTDAMVEFYSLSQVYILICLGSDSEVYRIFGLYVKHFSYA